jgi:hypothetical protein
MDYKKELINKINKLLKKEITVPEFEDKYYLYFLDEIPDDALSDNDNEFFSEIQEKLDWVSEKPEEDERKYGWINYEEFIEWLKTKMENYNG